MTYSCCSTRPWLGCAMRMAVLKRHKKRRRRLIVIVTPAEHAGHGFRLMAFQPVLSHGRAA